ncbi:phage minor head protein [Pelagimonas sp. KU-00592-HH]|uniref:phage minor head protein n=1 Tax=Pelagimonas sp. KU-00592-HH TaxID=3127651 RepID=UPI0031086DFE
MTAAEDILVGNVRHAIYLQRYSTQTVNMIARLLGRLDDRIVERLLREDLTDISRVQLQRLLDAIRKINVDAYVVLNGEFRKEVREFVRYETEFQAELLQAALPIQWDVISPAPHTLYSAVSARPFQGRLLREWMSDLEANAFKRVRDAIRMGVVEGLTTGDIVRQIRGTRANGYRDGILHASRRGTEAMVRTALSHTASVARDRLYQENESLVKGWRFVATLDGRTTAECRALDGTTYAIGKGPKPPRHIGCRSVDTPILKSWKELGLKPAEAPEGTRSSLNGQVPENLTFEDYLRKESREFQDNVLGKSKAKLFRNGGLSLDRFVDFSGEEYTLDELRKREVGAFERAGL